MVTLWLMTPSGLRCLSSIPYGTPWVSYDHLPLLCADAHEGEAGPRNGSELFYRPAWVPARAGALASSAATDGVTDAAATVILPCRRSSA